MHRTIEQDTKEVQVIAQTGTQAEPVFTAPAQLLSTAVTGSGVGITPADDKMYLSGSGFGGPPDADVVFVADVPTSGR